MGFLTIDADKCNKDGLCEADCPMRIIQMKKGELPAGITGAADMCIRCGHCVAICPTGALSIDTMTPEQCLPVNTDMLLNPEQAEHFLRHRRSIRNYKEKQVDKDSLSELIRIASHAPTGHNMQPVTWQVIYEREDVLRLSEHVIDWMKSMIREKPEMAKAMHLDLVVMGWSMGRDTISRSAPHLILASGAKADRTAKSACTIAMAYLELALPAFGLGGCWNGYFNAAALTWPPLKHALGLDKDLENHGVMMVGFPKLKYQRMPTRNEPKVSWI